MFKQYLKNDLLRKCDETILLLRVIIVIERCVRGVFKEYIMKTNKLIQLYSRANLLVDSVFELSIPAKSVLKGGRTVKDVCGFLIPLSGQAIYKVNNTEYHLSPGFILHAGSSMPLSKEVVGDQKWDYILMHYKVIGESESKIYLENKDYGVSLNESQMNKVQELARGLLKLHKRTDLREQLKKKNVAV